MSEPFTCPLCDATSWHPQDIENGYCGRCHAFTRQPVMTMWTIFDHPLDEPDHVVVRGFDLYNGLTEPRPRDEGYLFNTVNDARLWLSERAPGAARLAPSEGDHPNVVETWV